MTFLSIFASGAAVVAIDYSVLYVYDAVNIYSFCYFNILFSSSNWASLESTKSFVLGFLKFSKKSLILSYPVLKLNDSTFSPIEYYWQTILPLK